MILVTWNIKRLNGTYGKRKRGRMRQKLHKSLIGGSLDILLL